MRGVKPFIATTLVSPEGLASGQMDLLVAEQLEAFANGDLRGPRGGRYRRLSQGPMKVETYPYPSLPVLMSCSIRFDAKYVAPIKETP